MYIAGTFCQETIPGTRRETSKNCESCDFYRMLKEEHGSEVSVFSFQKYVKDINRDLTGMTGREICRFSPLIRKGKRADADSRLKKDNLSDIWLHLLRIVDYCNHAVKQGEWYQEDIGRFYGLKDAVMEKLYRNSPPGTMVNLQKVPYIKSLNNEKEEPVCPATRKHYHTDSVCPLEPKQSSGNSNMKETILIEMQVTHAGQMFCFHIPFEKIKDWGLSVMALNTKKWVPSREFNRQFFRGIFEEIKKLLDLISGIETIEERAYIGSKN